MKTGQDSSSLPYSIQVSGQCCLLACSLFTCRGWWQYIKFNKMHISSSSWQNNTFEENDYQMEVWKISLHYV
jgi:hypothetical protein